MYVEKGGQRRLCVVSVCQLCGLEFSAIAYEVRRGGGKFCSRNCQRTLQARANAEAMRVDLTRSARNKQWKLSVPPVRSMLPTTLWRRPLQMACWHGIRVKSVGQLALTRITTTTASLFQCAGYAGAIILSITAQARPADLMVKAKQSATKANWDGN